MSDIVQRNNVLQSTLEGMKKHPSIDAEFRRMFLTCVQKHIEEMTIVKKQFKINTQFFSWFIVDMELDKHPNIKEEKSLYRNFLRLKKFQLIHPKSASFFPKSLTLLSVNPNHFSLLAGGLSKLDVFIEARNIVFTMLKKKETRVQGAYIYLRLFSSTPLYESALKNLTAGDVICLPSHQVLLVHQENLTFDVSEETGAYRLELQDEHIVDFFIFCKRTLLENEIIFNDTSLEKVMKDFKDKHLPGLTIHLIKNLNKNFYLFYSSPLKLTLESKIVSSVPLTLNEVDSIFPNQNILSAKQQEIESVRIEQVFKRREVVEKESKEKSKKAVKEESTSYAMMDIESLSELLRTKGTKYTTLKVEECISEIKTYLDNTSILHDHLLFGYVLYLLEFLLRRKLALSTVKTYLGLLNKHLFQMVDNLADIKPEELTAISHRLEVMRYKSASVQAVYKNIRRFFRFHKRKHPELMDISTLYYPKSLVFKCELNDILANIEVEYKMRNEVKNIGPTVRFNILQRKILVLFGFYFGLRKSEIRSRLMEDFYYYGDNFYMDINSKGLNKIKRKLKTAQSKRRVHANITDAEHRKIIDEWIILRERMDKRYNYLFLAKGSGNKMLQSAIEERVFDEITQAIKEVTQRYCTYHSLRHSFATYRVKEMLEKGIKTPYALLELAIEMGHQTPDTTLSAYVHYEVMMLHSQ